MGWGAFASVIGQSSSNSGGGLSFVPGYKEFTSIHGQEMNRRDRIHAGQEARQHNVDMFNLSSAFNAQEAEKNRAFQAKILKKRNLYAMRDLENAGLNPLLALGNPGSASGAQASASGGGGGETPTGEYDVSGSSSAKFSMQDIIAQKKIRKELEILDAQKKNIQANTRKQHKEGNVLKRKETESGIINKALLNIEKLTHQVPKFYQNATSAMELYRHNKDLEENRKWMNERKIKIKGDK